MADDSLDGATVKSALRVMLIIELLTKHDRGLSFTALQEELDVPKSSLFSLLRTMTARGHLLFDDKTRIYRLGVRYWEAGQAFLRGTDLPRTARSYLEAASAELGETTQLSVLDGLENVYIAKVEAEQRLQLVSQVGSRLPAHATGLGKVLLAHLHEDDLEERLAGAELASFTPSTIADKDELFRELRTVRERGYATDKGEYTPGVYCVAVPVYDHQDQVVASMSCSVPDVRLTAGFEGRMLDALRTQARGLSQALGSSSSSAASA